MGFSEWSTGKKIIVSLVVIVAIVAIVGVVSYFVSGYSNTNTFNVAQGEYKVKIETENGWTSYITTDSKYSQDAGTGSKTIDLGTVNSLSSITIDQQGAGNTKVSIIDSNNKVIAESSTSTDYASIYFLLKVQ